MLYDFYINIYNEKNPELWRLVVLLLEGELKTVSFKKDSFVKKRYKTDEKIDKLFRIKNKLGLLSYNTSRDEMEFIDYNGKSIKEWLNIKEIT